MKIDKPLFLSIIAPWAILISIVLSGIFNIDTSYIEISFIVYFLAGFSLFYLFLILGNQTKAPDLKRHISNISYILLALLLVTVTFRLIDRFIFREVSDIFSIADYRTSREQSSNIFSMIAAITTPVSIILAQDLFEKQKLTYFKRLIVIILLAFVITDVVLSGSRGTILVIATILLGDKINKRSLLFLTPLGVIAFSLFFIYRYQSLTEVNDLTSLLINISTYGYATFVPASSSLLDHLSETNSFTLIIFSLIQTAQYLLHGIFEFAYLYEKGPDFQLSPAQFIPHLSLLYEHNPILERYNLYYTLMGTLHISFGHFSIAFMALTGFFLGYTYKIAKKYSSGSRNLAFLPILLSPFVNGIGGYDIYLYIISIYFCYFFFKRRAK